MKKLKVGYKSQLSALSDFIVMTILLILVDIYFSNIVYYKISIIIWLVSCAPALYLHLQYLRYCKNYAISFDNSRLIIYRNGTELSKDYECIKDITLYKSGNLGNWNIRYDAFEAYHIAKINFNDDSYILIPNVMSTDLEKDLKQYLPNYKKVPAFFCSINKYQ